MTALARILYPVPAIRRSPLALLGWWERRRPVYNLVVGATGLVTLTTVTILMALSPGAHFTPSVVPLIGVLVYGVMANLCYSLGFVIELALELLWDGEIAPVGPFLFRQGLLFSVGLTLLPIMVAWVGWLINLIHYVVR